MAGPEQWLRAAQSVREPDVAAPPADTTPAPADSQASDAPPATASTSPIAQGAPSSASTAPAPPVVVSAATSPPKRAAQPVEADPNARTTALLDEGDGLFAAGSLLSPAGGNAVERYLAALGAAPNDKLRERARSKLGDAVTRVAAIASDMILQQRFDGARQLLRRLSVAIPADVRRTLPAHDTNHWRVVDLILEADTLMQRYQIVEPENDNAVALLREALRIEPKNAIADEMLTKAYGLLGEIQRRSYGGNAGYGPVSP